MTASEFIKKAKVLFSGVKLAKLQLSNKSTINFDTETLTKGSAVYLENASGEETRLPDNTPDNPSYALENGGSFTIKDGKVDSVTNAPAAVKQEETVVKEDAVSTDASAANIQELLTALATALQPIQESLNQVLNVLPGLCMMSKAVPEMKAALGETIKAVEEMSKEPSAPVKMTIAKPTIPTESSKEAKESREYRIINSK